MAKAVYAGTFDPVTLGHLHIIRRAAKLFESLTVAVAESTGKRTVFTAEERARLVREEVEAAIRPLRKQIAELKKELADVGIVMTHWGSTQYDAGLLDAAPKLKILAHCAGTCWSRLN